MIITMKVIMITMMKVIMITMTTITNSYMGPSMNVKHFSIIIVTVKQLLRPYWWTNLGQDSIDKH